MNIDYSKYNHLTQCRMVDGSIRFLQNGELHNDVGPAIIYPSRNVFAIYLEGVRYIDMHRVNGVMKITPTKSIEDFTVHKAIGIAITFCIEYGLTYDVVIMEEE